MASTPDAFDVVIVGSGPAGTAVAERLCSRQPDVTVAVVERGPHLLDRHFYDLDSDISQRDRFLDDHRQCPWEGDLSDGGLLLPGVGGRGMVGGSQLHRFYDADLSLWSAGRWPVSVADLTPYFEAAERRLLGPTRATSAAQRLVSDFLRGYGATHPPASDSAETVEPVSAGAGFPHRSSVERVLGLAARGDVTLLTQTTATSLVTSPAQPDRVTAVRAIGPGSPGGHGDIAAGVVVLAASPVESARLVMASGLADSRAASSPIGAYLAEHIYCRGVIEVPDAPELTSGAVNVFLPPPGPGLDQRFQVEVRSMPGSAPGRALFRLNGSAAMDPVRSNRVALGTSSDGHGARRATTVMTYTDDDRTRVERMRGVLEDARTRLGGSWLHPATVLPRGASYHEAGTLRMGPDSRTSPADADALLRGTTNVFVGDGAAFPCVGVANPTLTITAMGYRLGDHVATLLGST